MSGKTSKKTLPCGRPIGASSETNEGSKALFERLVGTLDAYVAQHQLNRSEARNKILETIVYESRHFTPQDLLARLEKRHPGVGKATLYRTLPVLVESGIIQQGPATASGQSLYELSHKAHHDHIICVDCGRIFEFEDNTIEKRQEQVTGELGFVPKAHQHVIYGACEFKRRKDRG